MMEWVKRHYSTLISHINKGIAPNPVKSLLNVSVKTKIRGAQNLTLYRTS